MKFSAFFNIAIGIAMFAQWAFFLAVGAVPELKTEPIRISLHLAAEFATAVMLIVSGMGLLRAWAWGRAVALCAAGMLAYTTIVSPGYFAQLGQWPMVVMFAVLLVLDGFSVAALLRMKN